MGRNSFLLCNIVWICTVGSLTPIWAENSSKVIIAYIFVKDRVIQPEEVAADQLTHINYAFANIKDGMIVEGFKNDTENYRVLNSLKVRNPRLKVLVSVGGGPGLEDSPR